jgi:hypothetical protein
VTIRGVDGAALFASGFDASTHNKFGSSAFVIAASHLIFEGLRFEAVGQCFRFDSNVSDITLQRFYAKNVGTCVDVTRGGTHQVRDLTITQAMVLQFTRGAFWLASRSSGVLIRDSYIDMQPDRIGGYGSDFPVGIAFYDETHDVEIHNTTVLNVVGEPAAFTQGDGTDGDASASDVIVDGCYFAGCSDSCAVAKAQRTLIRDTIAAGCRRNFGFWQANTLPEGGRCERCTSYQPNEAHFLVDGNQATATDIAVYSDNAAVLALEIGGGSLHIDGLGGTISGPNAVNVTSISNNQVEYGRVFSVPPPPNPTPFTP